MTYLDITFLKYFLFVSLLMGIGSFKAWADLPLPMESGNLDSFSHNFFNALTETQKYLLTGDGILVAGFFLWIAYIVFCFPRDKFKKL